MINHKDNFLNFFVLIYFFLFCYFQVISQHWTSIPDQDTVVLYNSLLVANNIEQEYLDHPSYSLFFVNALVLKIVNLLGFVNIDFIKNINSTKNFDHKFQVIFYILKAINIFIFFFSILIFKKIMKKLKFSFHQITVSILIILINFYTLQSFFLIRAEPLSILFFLTSLYFLIKFNNKQKFKFLFLFSLFMILSIFSKMQILFNYFFLLLFLIVQSKNYRIINISKIFQNPKYIFLCNFLILFSYLVFVTILSYSSRYNGEILPEKYLIYIISIIIFLIFFIKNLKFNDYFLRINQLILLIFLSIFVSILFFLLLDLFNLFAFNPRILLRLFLPLYYMLVFVNEPTSYNLIDKSNYIIFSDIPTFIYFIAILILGFIFLFKNLNLKNLINEDIYFYLLLMTIFVFFSFLFRGPYYYLIIFNFLILSNYFLNKKIYLFHYSILFLFIINISINFNELDRFYKPSDNINKICTNEDNIRSYMRYWHQRFDDKFLDKFCEIK